MHNIESDGAKKVAMGLAFVVSTVMLAGSGYFNYQFGFKLGRSYADGVVFGVIGVGLEVLLAIMPFLFAGSLKAKERVTTFSMLIGWTVLVAVSATAAIGHIASSRMDAMSNKVVAATAYKDARDELKRLNDRLGWLPKPSDSEGSLRAKIKGQQSSLIWQQTQSCANQWNAQTIKFCKGITDLSTALDNTIEYNKITVRIAELQNKSDTAVANHTQIFEEGADAQANILGKVLGTDVTTTSGLISILFASVILMVASLGFHWSLAPQRAAIRARQLASAPDVPQPLQSGPAPLLIDITPSAQKLPAGYLASPQDIGPEARELLRAIGMPEKACDKRPKDIREVLGWRFYSWMVANKLVGDFTADQITAYYNAFAQADNREAWGERVAKTEFEGIGQRYVSSGLRLKEDGSRGTMWAVKPCSIQKLLEVLRKRGIVPKEMPPPEPEPVAEAPEAPKNVFSIFGGKKAS